MSRRGAGSTLRREGHFDLMPAPALARRVVALAKELMGEGLTPAEVSSLFTDAAQVLSKQRGGLTREEWLELCAELYDRDGHDEPAQTVPRFTAPGGVS